MDRKILSSFKKESKKLLFFLYMYITKYLQLGIFIQGLLSWLLKTTKQSSRKSGLYSNRQGKAQTLHGNTEGRESALGCASMDQGRALLPHTHCLPAESGHQCLFCRGKKTTWQIYSIFAHKFGVFRPFFLLSKQSFTAETPLVWSEEPPAPWEYPSNVALLTPSLAGLMEGTSRPSSPTSSPAQQ